MNSMTLITATEGNDQFYPTPTNVADKMLEGIDWSMIKNVLEPSAGKGNLVLSAIIAHKKGNSSYGSHLDIDCIEIDPYLRAILKENHESEWTREMREALAVIEAKRYDERTQEEQDEKWKLDRKISSMKESVIHIVHDNFLTYRSWRKYDLILMNPPFAQGDLHLLKALEIQKNGGSIVCLLNAETLNNPYTNTRKLLRRELEKYGAQVSFIQDAFKDAERTADVTVAVVRVTIPECQEFHSDIWERMEKAAEAEKQKEPEITDLVVGDYIEAAVQRFNVEVSASMELIRQYNALRPYIMQELNAKERYEQDSILRLSVGGKSCGDDVDIDEYLHTVRLKYWRALFHNEKFMGRLTSDLRKQYLNKIDTMAFYDFSLFNIRTVMTEMNSQVFVGVKEAIFNLFDTLTAEYSWYPESKSNIHYFNGWATNKAHKIGKKSIIPGYNIFSSYSQDKEIQVYYAVMFLSDIEKVFDYLNGCMSNESDIRARISYAKEKGQTRNIQLKYFDVDLFKKGTVHIKYKNMELVDKMNIYAARNKSWLPPYYGKVRYDEMDDEGKTVIDSFQGKENYEKVMQNSAFYLSEPTRTLPMLED